MRSLIVSRRPAGEAHAADDGPGFVDPDDPVALAAAIGVSSEPVLVASTKRRASRLALLVAVASACHPDTPIAWRAVPTASVAVRDLLSRVAGPAVAPALAVTWFDHAVRATWSGAWMPSVSGLVHPTPTVVQHFRSWLPGRRSFVALHGHPPTVIDAGALATIGPAGAPGNRVLLVSGTLPGGLGTALAAAAGTEASELVAAAADAKDEYGVATAVEFAAVPTDGPAAMTSTGYCPSCRAAVASDSCPFCHVRATRQEIAA